MSALLGARPRRPDWRRLPAKAARFLLTLAAAAAGAGAAIAQDIPEVISPLRVETDHNGVNLVTGRMQVELPVLSVPAAPNLRFDRIQNAAPYALGRAQGSVGEGQVINWSVHTGTGASESFRCDSGTCTSVTGTGSTFGGNSYVQAGSGARWNFHYEHFDDTGTNPNGTAQYYLSSIHHPNGEVISWEYFNVTSGGRVYRRPIKIASNLGYHISIAYQSSTFTDPGWSLPASATLMRSSDDLVVGRLTYSGDTITDHGGRVYTCTGCSNALGTQVETASATLRLPGETADALVVTPVSGTHVVGSVTRDGVAWNYSYANLRENPNSDRDYWYDSLTVTGPDGYRRVYAMYVSDQRNVIDRMTENVTGSTTRTFDYQFDAAYRPELVVEPEGNSVGVSYDEYGNVRQRTMTPKPGSGEPVLGEGAFLDTAACTGVLCYRPTHFIDALGRRTDFTWFGSGQIRERTDPADESGVRRRTIHQYETTALGLSRLESRRVCGTDVPCGTTSEIRTNYDYWAETFLPSEERRVDGARGVILTTTYAYDPAGRLLTVDGPLAGAADTVHYSYDVHGRRVREVGPLGANGLRQVQVHTYRDADDRIVRSETGTVVNPDDAPTVLSRVEYTYDARRYPQYELVASGSTIYSLLHRRFTSSGRLECEARRMDPGEFPEPRRSTNACAREPWDLFGHDRIRRFYYDSAGQLLQEARAYDVEGLHQIYAAYSYTPNGNRASVTDANGNRAELRYDGHDRLERWVFPSRTAPGTVDEADYELYGYDAAGNRTSLRKRDGSTLGYSYDALDRLVRKTVPERAGLDPVHTRDVFYAYDIGDRMTLARFDSLSGQGVTNSYDGFGRLLSSRIAMDGHNFTVASAYDSAGNRTQATYGGQSYVYAYDAASRLTQIREGSATGTLLAQFSYTPQGQVDLRSDGSAASAIDYSHDAIGRLTGQSHSFPDLVHDVAYGYSYNPAGQLHSRTRSNDIYAWSGDRSVDETYGVNGLNQYVHVDGAPQGYDANGNLTSDGSTSYAYDVENRLVAASGFYNGALRYDPLGRLWEINVASGIRRLVWDSRTPSGDALVVEYHGTGSLAARYVHGVGTGDDPLVWRGGGLNRRLHADHLGSIVAITEPSGAVVAINTYDEWGRPGAIVGRFGFTGQVWIGELGLNYYKARMYSPRGGRFMQVDPVGYDDQMNLYAYVGNDPVNETDYSGRMRNCEVGDSTCVETPESEERPGNPPPVSPEEQNMGEIIVTGRRPQIDYREQNEEYFVVFGDQMSRRGLRQRNIRCPGGSNVRVGEAAPLGPGQMGAHSHGRQSEAVPGPGDDNAVRGSTARVAGVMTPNRSLSIRMFANGTFRVRLTEGPPLSTEERGQLVRNMQRWERGAPPRSQSARSWACR